MSEVQFTSAIVVGGKLVHADSDAALPWWSFGKTVIAAAALALVRDGRLELHAPIRGMDFSVAELLSHRAGQPDYANAPRYQEAVAAGGRPWTGMDFLARSQIWKRPPKGAFAYSNIGYLLLRKLIEGAMDTGLGDALKSLVFDPLEIKGPRLATTRADIAPLPAAAPPNYHPDWVAHGLIVGAPAQAALLLDRLMRTDFLPENLKDEMLKGGPVGGPWPDRPWRKAAYGLGVMIDSAGPLGRQAGHSGQGYSTCAVYHFLDCAPPRTVAVFSPASHEAAAEWEAIRLAEKPPA